MKYFESKDDVFHFLVCPQDDYFITNTLEKLDYHEYMYRVLRNKGYERIIFFEYIRELNGKDVQSKRILTFDRYSYESYINQKVYEDGKSAEHIEVRSNGKKQLNTAKYNEAVKMHSLFKERSEKIKNSEDENREIISLNNNEFRKFVSSKTFDDPGLIYSEIINNIVPALLSEKIRTAIIMPVGIFKEVQNSRKSAALGDVIDALNDVYEHQNLKNILIFTMNELGSLEEMCPFFDMLRGFKSGKSDGLDGAIKYLSKNNRFNQVNEIGIDEITNLLLRKKMNIDSKNNEKVQLFYDKIPYVKLSALSYMIYEQHREGKENLKNLEFPNTITFGIKRLETELESEELLSELVERSLTVPALELKLYNETSALDLSRFTHEKIRVNIPNNDTIESVYAEFDKLVGKEMQKVKKYVLDSVAYFKAERKEYEEAIANGEKPEEMPYINMQFLGSPGTGKTTVARLVGKLLHAEGILPSSKYEDVSATKLIIDTVGGTEKLVREAAKKASGGVLFIDEFYALDKEYNGGNLGKDAMDAIVDVINEQKDSLCIIVGGYEKDTEKILSYNPGGLRRFPHKVKFEDYSIESLMVIMEKMLASRKKALGHGVREALEKVIRADKAILMNEFGNAGYIANMLGELKKAYISRRAEDNIYTLEDVLAAFPDKASLIGEETDTIESVYAEFDKLVGEEMQKVKKYVLDSVAYFKAERKEYEESIANGEKPEEMPYINMQFLGSPGTGKTTVARLVGKLLHAEGILPSSKYEDVSATKLISNTVGGTEKLVREAAKKASGGVLFIDEFYALDKAYNGGNLGKDAMDAVVDVINEQKDSLCIIVGGYEKDTEKILSYNPGGLRRFPHKVKFEDYSIESLMIIMDKMLDSRKKTLGDGVKEALEKVIRADKAILMNEFGNAGYISNMLGELKKAYISRHAEDNIYTLEDVLAAFPDKASLIGEETDTIESVYAEFDKLVGEEMQKVKKYVLDSVAYFKAERKEYEETLANGEKPEEMPYINMQFLGSPGTGKTTVARLVGKLLHAEGILPSSKYEDVSATKLISNTVGGTEKLVREAAKKASGGVLFIDEFYALDKAYNGGNLGKDAMDAVVDVINEQKDSLCIIVGGYEKDTEKILSYNPGGLRRFPHKVKFEDYSIESLMIIMDKMLDSRKKTLAEGVRDQLEKIIRTDKIKLKNQFGNAGYIANMLGELKKAYIARNGQDDTYSMEDVDVAFPQHTKQHISDGKDKSDDYKLLLSDMIDLPDFYQYEQKGTDNAKEELFKLTEPSVLYLEVEFGGNKGFGTGFLIHPDGYALTCNHVIKSREGKVADKITARLRIPGRMGGEDTYHNCVVVKTFEELDMALIKTTDGSNFPYLKLEKQEFEAKEFDEFLLLGYPFGERTKAAISVNVGRIVSIQNNPDGNGIDRYNIQCEAKKGNSGSPAISLKTGSVIGLLPGAIKAYEGDYEEINYLRPIKYFWTEFFK